MNLYNMGHYYYVFGSRVNEMLSYKQLFGKIDDKKNQPTQLFFCKQNDKFKRV